MYSVLSPATLGMRQPKRGGGNGAQRSRARWYYPIARFWCTLKSIISHPFGVTMVNITLNTFHHNAARNLDYLRQSLDGLTHADALVQPPVTGNCILWIVGHVVCYRNYALTTLNLPLALDEAAANRFARDSAPVLADEPALARLEALSAAFEASQTALLDGIAVMPAADLEHSVTMGRFTMPRAELILNYLRHEAYHIGQLEWLREWVLAQRAR
jgi:hypothetical protein